MFTLLVALSQDEGFKQYLPLSLAITKMRSVSVIFDLHKDRDKIKSIEPFVRKNRC